MTAAARALAAAAVLLLALPAAAEQETARFTHPELGFGFDHPAGLEVSPGAKTAAEESGWVLRWPGPEDELTPMLAVLVHDGPPGDDHMAALKDFMDRRTDRWVMTTAGDGYRAAEYLGLYVGVLERSYFVAGLAPAKIVEFQFLVPGFLEWPQDDPIGAMESRPEEVAAFDAMMLSLRAGE